MEQDPRDAIITQLQLRLAKVVDKTRYMDSLVVELNDDYRAKSDEVLSLKMNNFSRDVHTYH